MNWVSRQVKDIQQGTGALLSLIPKALFWALVAILAILWTACVLISLLAAGIVVGLSSLDSWLCSWGTNGKG